MANKMNAAMLLALTTVITLAPSAHAATQLLPVSYTPHVLGTAQSPSSVATKPRTVNEFIRVGNYMYSAGIIDEVQNNGSSTIYRFGNIFRFNATTGAVDSSFKPMLLGSGSTVEEQLRNGEVWALEATPDGRYLFIGGDFRFVNGKSVTGLVKWDLQTNTLVTTFNPILYAYGTTPAKVNDIKYVGGNLFVASNATKINGTAGSQLMSLDPTTGIKTNYLNIGIAQSVIDPAKYNIGPVKVQKVAINSQKTHMVIIGNFRQVAGQERVMIALLKLGTSGATLAPWYPKSIMQKTAFNYDMTTVYPSNLAAAEGLCREWAAACMRDVSWTPGGGAFMLATTGGNKATTTNPYPGLTDSVSRWNINSTSENSTDAKYAWLNATNADTFLSVHAENDYAYVGGHFKSLNYRLYSASVGGKAMPTTGTTAEQFHYGIGRISLSSGVADATFNPSNSDAITSRGYGWGGMYYNKVGTSGLGLWVGGDTEKFQYQTRKRILFFPQQ